MLRGLMRPFGATSMQTSRWLSRYRPGSSPQYYGGVEQMSVSEVSAGIQDLAGRAREGRLKQHEIEGGAFSVSNLGMYGVREFAAIINRRRPGSCRRRATRRPTVSEDGEIQVATVMTVTLSADHRVIDGAIAAQWLAAFTKRIENPLSILI